MTIADESMAERCLSLINSWGSTAYLLRENVARECTAAILGNTPRSRGLAEEDAKQMLIAAPLEIEPDPEIDALWFEGNLYQFVGPIKGPKPGGIPIYFDCDVVYERVLDITPYI